MASLRARTALLTGLTLVAFAANSLLCRQALRGGAIDALSFTALRLCSGALVLQPFLRGGARRWNVRAGLALFVYALGFSLSYTRLPAGTGALLLFGAVQVTMLSAAWGLGERFGPLRLVGMAAAIGGVVWLVLPGVAAPSPFGAAAMVTAGLAWGVYSLIGRGTPAPKAATARNFVLAAPAALLALALGPFLGAPPLVLTPAGAAYAIASGAITSGLGYVLWYTVLPSLTATSAAILQLCVPVIAALGGVAWLGETLTERLVVAGALTLGGVAVAVLAKRA